MEVKLKSGDIYWKDRLIITDKELESWSGMDGADIPMTYGDIGRMVEEIIRLRKFTKKLIEQKEGMYGKIQNAISTILFDSIRNEVDVF